MNIADGRASPDGSSPGVPAKVLRGIGLLSALGENELDLLARTATRQACPRGSLISTAGSSSEAVHILLSGRVKVFLKGTDGREIILRILGPGELIFEMDVLDDNPSFANVAALAACEFIRVARRDFKRCVAANFDMAMLVVRELERRLRDAEGLIANLARMSVIGRVLHLLRQAAEVVNGRTVVRRKLSHQDIASRVGSSRVAVTHALKHLQLRGQVEVRDGSMILLDGALPSRE